MTPDQRKRIEAIAAMNQTTVPGLLREAVDNYIADCSDEIVFAQDRAAS